MNATIIAIILVLGMVLSSTTAAFAQVTPNIPGLKSPLDQFNSGIKIQDIRCQPALVLVIKSENGHPACVKESTAQRLVSLNWGIISQIQNKPVVIEQNPSSANNNFAFAFLSKIPDQKVNIFFSPYSISDAFSMAYEGAKGNTAKQLQSVFGFIQDDATRKNTIKSQNEQLISTDKYQLNTANAWWVQNNYHILPSYADTLQNYYKAQITSLDLKNDSENSRKTINMWVENKTNQKIIDLLPPGSINYQTRAVLTNAVYFKANWTSQFAAEDTSDQNFTTYDGTHVRIPMMRHAATFPYYEDNTVQVLDMPYQGDRLSMVVILPKTGIQSLGTITQDRFNNWNNKLSDVPVNVYMPKFTLDTKYTLNDMLDAMGITDAFDPNVADFSGITGNHDLSISTAIHQAYVRVDEQGTEAAAATGVVSQVTSALLSQHTFRADHPFVFMIYDKQTDLILFLGQVTNPVAS